MRRTIVLAVLSPLLFLAPPLPAGGARAGDPPQAKPKREPVVAFENQRYYGEVTVIAKDSITIRTPERVQETFRPGPGGITQREAQVLPAEPPKKFSLSVVLAAGAVPKEPRGGYQVPVPYMYRLTDVKVGDLVLILYARVDGVDTCDHIKIQKRPGGRVPSLPEGVEKTKGIRYHESMNAYWNLEDKGIPYPEKFGELRRFPVAPPPREVPVPKLRDS